MEMKLKRTDISQANFSANKTDNEHIT